MLMPPLDSTLSALVDISFDCPSNLKEAIDWILRVTGKDGGGGDGDASKLAKAITQLPDFQQAITAAADKLKESGSVDISQALGKLKSEITLKGIIEKLAGGLGDFIGYNGKGQGIALVIDPLQQLRKGVLLFLSELIRKLSGQHKLTGVNDKDRVSDTLSGAVGKGKSDFDVAIEKLKGISGNGGSISNVVDALQKVKELTNKQTVNEFADAVSQFMTGVLKAVKVSSNSEIQSLCTSLPALVTAYGKQNNEITTMVKAVETHNKKINHAGRTNTLEQVLTAAVHNGTKYLLEQLKKDGYKSAYLGQSWDVPLKNHKAAQIFLGCLPLYYYWLTYLYWKCRENGGWAVQNLARPDLKHFMVGMGYNSTHFTTSRVFKGSNIATLLESLDKLTTTATQSSHPDFLNELNKSLQLAVSSVGSSAANLNGHSLSALFYLCRCYFTGRQIINPVTERRSPTSIREMLYWLSGLQFSPQYSDIQKQIEKHIPDGVLHVADSGISASSTGSTGDTLTQSQMKGFLLSSCLSAPGVLGAIQGNSADTDEGEPWLYSLFCNTMNLHYPSGAALFNTLANYSYALQFQLYFLYIQCRTNYSQSYGWQWCRYGQSAQPSGKNAKELASWICSSSNCLNISCQHNSDRCQHIKECGQSGQPSPLQAFLTDNLKGFHVSFKPSPSSPNHLENHPPGSMCHIPMGLAGALTKDTNATGWYIYYLLDNFCGNSKTPLRQLSEKLGCLTRRTPRTLGDLFGFLWNLNGQLFKARPKMDELAAKLVNAIGDKNPSKIIPQFLFDMLNRIAQSSSPSGTSTPTGLSKSLETLAPTIPFLYQLFMVDPDDFLPGKLYDVRQHCHKVESSGSILKVVHQTYPDSSFPSGHPCYNSANDLWSICQPVSAAPTNGRPDTQADCRGAKCGGYLSPLTHSAGATYAPVHASAYLSWVIYLVDDLYEQLYGLKMAFEDLKCSQCSPRCNHDKCHNANNCSCPSVVQCSGVLPLLYANGLNFTSATSLTGWRYHNSRWTQDGENKRSCDKFHDQLTAVLAQDENTPLRKLLLTIDDLLYMFRFYFFYNLSTFWIMQVDRTDEAHILHAVTKVAVI
ncbi:variant erythrocyte surface antigen-1 family protein [Babesia caballi]|uniref:Variant erythrocyte surface antigen-1 family protein n=1 Tax=Babesia caballi TaxID=5871 RepID=A0AAV4LY02_BABCB|nr:variant erythrocyte surface antigen-1 family protein [Babesia caballi]